MTIRWNNKGLINVCVYQIFKCWHFFPFLYQLHHQSQSTGGLSEESTGVLSSSSHSLWCVVVVLRWLDTHTQPCFFFFFAFPSSTKVTICHCVCVSTPTPPLWSTPPGLRVWWLFNHHHQHGPLWAIGLVCIWFFHRNNNNNAHLLQRQIVAHHHHHTDTYTQPTWRWFRPLVLWWPKSRRCWGCPLPRCPPGFQGLMWHSFLPKCCCTASPFWQTHMILLLSLKSAPRSTSTFTHSFPPPKGAAPNHASNHLFSYKNSVAQDESLWKEALRYYSKERHAERHLLREPVLPGQE